MARTFGIHTDERAWRIGAHGERLVGQSLASLPEGWHALHDLPIGPGEANLDHLVIGPGGIFSLNAKYLNSRVWVAEHAVLVDGHRTDFMRKSRREAKRVGMLLGRAAKRWIDVQPVLVLMCDQLTIKCPPAVPVLTRRQLSPWLTGQPIALSPTDVDRLATTARDPATWERTPERGTGSGDTPH